MSISSVIKAARKNAPNTDGMTVAELEAAIEGISAHLRGPGVSHAERLTLNEDRHAYRRALSAHSNRGEEDNG